MTGCLTPCYTATLPHVLTRFIVNLTALGTCSQQQSLLLQTANHVLRHVVGIFSKEVLRVLLQHVKRKRTNREWVESILR